MLHLITGATGDVGSKVAEEMLARGQRVRILVRNPDKAHVLFGGQVEMFVGNLADPSALTKAMEGVQSVFLVNSGPEIPKRDEIAAIAAQGAGVKHLVKLSSLDVQHGLAIGAWHEHGEAAIRAVGPPFTFLRPSGFMSNLLAWANSIREEGIVRSCTGEGRRAFIHSSDIAAVASEVLVSGGYVGKSLFLTGPEALTFSEVTAKISGVIGKPLIFQPISDAEARHRYAATGAPFEETEAHVALWRAIREGRLAMVTDTVETILHRKPVGLEPWISENAAAFAGTRETVGPN
jgi:(4-alkanoyl-5-oxo-2,5-dihydrofuran-3-yl)methyl phosphate reductase